LKILLEQSKNTNWMGLTIQSFPINYTKGVGGIKGLNSLTISISEKL